MPPPVIDRTEEQMDQQIVVFHPGTQHSWQTASALQQLGRLELYATSIFYQPDRWPYRLEHLLPPGLAARAHAEFRRFSHPGLDPALVHTSGAAEWIERLLKRGGFRRLSRYVDAFGNRQFARSLRSRIASSRRFGLWGYSGSSVDAFRAEGANGRLKILDRTIGDWRAYNDLIAETHQDYAEFFPRAPYLMNQAQIDRDDAEYALADVILTGSPFAAETVRARAADREAAGRVRVLNYCYDEHLFATMPPPGPVPRDGPLRFLFLGQAGPRKGIHLVLKVFERIPISAATLTIVGDLLVPPETFTRYTDRVTFHPTVARADVPTIMANADVLLFPSYFEGSALSLIEGLAAGLALIQSSNAGVGVTPDTGLLLPELTEAALESAVMTAIEDRAEVERWRSNAQAVSRRYGFQHYRSNIAAMLSEVEDLRAS
jgi:glycosyltransferase involved in cell wall biosynthesis